MRNRGITAKFQTGRKRESKKIVIKADKNKNKNKR